MELDIRFTVRLSPDTAARILVLAVMVLTVLAARETGYGPGTTAFPAAIITAALAAVQAAGALARPRPASLPGA
jgi:hypothetical protein